MKKHSLFVVLLSLLSLTGCKKEDKAKVISVAASESPHAEILKNAVKPLLEKQGYTLDVKVLDWTLQNDGVYNHDYDANYFQHRPYLQNYDSGTSNYNPDYTYTKVFPVALVHFEPLRIYEGKAKAEDFSSNKTKATYEICSDTSNAIRALDLLKACGAIEDYETDDNGNPVNLPKNITLIDENQLVAQKDDYDYAVLPCNTALTGHLTANPILPVEGDEVRDLRANVLAANVKSYKTDATYKTKIDALTDAILDESVKSYIEEKYSGVILADLKDLRSK